MSMYNSFLHSFLKENYPNVLDEANKHFIDDINEIDKIVVYFCSYHHIDADLFKTNTSGKNLISRYKLLCSLLYLYQPAKLNANLRLNEALAKKLKEVTGYDSLTLFRSIRAATNYYLYKDFSTSVKHFCNTYKLLR